MEFSPSRGGTWEYHRTTQSQVLAHLTSVTGFVLEGKDQKLASTPQAIQMISDADKKVSAVFSFCVLWLSVHRALSLQEA